MLALTVFAVIVAAIAPSYRAGATENVQTLFQECNAENPSYDLAHCIGIIEGAGDLMGINGLLITKYDDRSAALVKFAFCPGKPEPTVGARIQVFKNWAARHPEQWGEQNFVGVIEALRETWPCQ